MQDARNARSSSNTAKVAPFRPHLKLLAAYLQPTCRSADVPNSGATFWGHTENRTIKYKKCNKKEDVGEPAREGLAVTLVEAMCSSMVVDQLPENADGNDRWGAR